MRKLWKLGAIRVDTRRLLIATVALAGFVALDVQAAPVNAASLGPPRLDPQVAQLLRTYPGSHLVNATTVRVRPGVDVAVVKNAGAKPHAGCPYNDLCLYQLNSFGGYQLNLWQCTFVNLGDIPFPTGGYWNDRLSSYVNNQTPGTQSSFYNWNGVNTWVYLWSSHAYDAQSDVLPYDNMVDGVNVAPPSAC